MNDGWAVTMTILDDVDDGVGGGEGRKGNYGCRWRRGPSSSGAYQLVFEGSRSMRDVVGEEGAAEFFRGPRWDRGRKQEGQEADTGSLDEKKVEEQLA